MNDLANAWLAGWDNFFVIVGSSGAALIGLQFVVITLMSEMRGRSTPASVGAFGTPTVVHLAAALLISAIMSAPWPSVFGLSVALALCGVPGLAYSATVLYRARRQTVYKPVWEDWIWHVILPCCAYGALTAAALLLRTGTKLGGFVIAGVALALLFIGIHNAWDTVTYLVVTGHGEQE